LEGDGFEVFQIESSELDAGVSVGGPVGPGVAEHGGVFGGDSVGEGQFVVVGSVEVEEVFDHPEKVFDLCFVARLLTNSRSRAVRVSSPSSTLPPGRIQYRS
jgi:hypothetical protein